MKFPDSFDQVRIDLEVDLAEKGGLQRFKTVGDIQKWFDEELEFWRWMHEAPATNHHGALNDLVSDYNRFNDAVRTAISSAKTEWGEFRSAMKQQTSIFEDKSNAEDTLEQAQSQIEQLSNRFTTVIEGLSKKLNHSITTEVIKSQGYITRFDPSASFVKEIAEREADEAIFALDQIILEAKQSGERRRVEVTGRMLATLHARNLNKKARHEKQAFEKSIVTWANELADFKTRYEELEQNFQKISDRHSEADTAWNERSELMATDFAELRRLKEEDLNNLKETFEVHMKLKGPMLYWTEKRDEHKRGKFWMGLASVVSGIIGVGAMAGSAYFLFPVEGPANVIPWRSIGFFTLISTSVLWLVRIFVKLMLSHIHLYADAREREVMISTFMALMRGEDGREGITKLDLALVLAPIFKPSTTGVIKDDGGPTTLTDFISRLAGKT